jgi:hypothetical protein
MQDTETVVAQDEGLDNGGGTQDAVVVGVRAPKIDVPLLLADKIAHGKDITECRWHKRYLGLRVPRNGCDHCMAIYNYRRQTGVREVRVPKKTYEQVVRENL